mmetsp:Transcript_117214/g.373359  ORF Transcript_117214/g.373359 Transcript_117214/m.373359 type:complete len:404 (+) Transcript_117214:265-1476(+)
MLLQSVGLEEEDGVVRSQSRHQLPIQRVRNLPDGARVRLQGLSQHEAVLTHHDDAQRSVGVAGADRALVGIHGRGHGHQASDADVRPPVHEHLVVLLCGDVVRAQRAVEAGRYHEAGVEREHQGARHRSGVRLHDGGARPGVLIVLPNDAVPVVLDEPSIVVAAARHVVDVRWSKVIMLLTHGRQSHLLPHRDAVLHDAQVVIGLGLVGVLDGPPPEVAVVAAGDHASATLLGIQKQHLDGLVVRRARHFAGVLRRAPHELDLHEDALPEQQAAVLGTRDQLAVRQLHGAHNVGQLRGAKLSDVSLELEAGEGEGHLPEADVAGAYRREHSGELAPPDVEHFLTVGLTLQQEPLVFPIPDRQHVVRGATQNRDLVLVVWGELNGGVAPLSALSQNAVQLHILE